MTYEDGYKAWGARVVYGFLFFLIIGVLLFNIVTGIIIDKFSALREEADERTEFFKTTSMISDLTRADYDEHNLNFDELTKTHQSEIDYVFLLAHLSEKPHEDFSGAESLIFDSFERKDFTWLPHKFSWEMQARGVGAELEDEDALQAALTELREWLAGSLVEQRGWLSTELRKLQKSQDLLAANLGPAAGSAGATEDAAQAAVSAPDALEAAVMDPSTALADLDTATTDPSVSRLDNPAPEPEREPEPPPEPE